MSGGRSTAIRSLLSKYTIASAAGDAAGHAIFNRIHGESANEIGEGEAR
jgi:hypothetical protein